MTLCGKPRAPAPVAGGGVAVDPPREPAPAAPPAPARCGSGREAAPRHAPGRCCAARRLGGSAARLFCGRLVVPGIDAPVLADRKARGVRSRARPRHRTARDGSAGMGFPAPAVGAASPSGAPVAAPGTAAPAPQPSGGPGAALAPAAVRAGSAPSAARRGRRQGGGARQVVDHDVELDLQVLLGRSRATDSACRTPGARRAGRRTRAAPRSPRPRRRCAARPGSSPRSGPRPALRPRSRVKPSGARLTRRTPRGIAPVSVSSSSFHEKERSASRRFRNSARSFWAGRSALGARPPGARRGRDRSIVAALSRASSATRVPVSRRIVRDIQKPAPRRARTAPRA